MDGDLSNFVSAFLLNFCCGNILKYVLYWQNNSQIHYCQNIFLAWPNLNFIKISYTISITPLNFRHILVSTNEIKVMFNTKFAIDMN